MAKDYYQSTNGGFRLEPSTYRLMSWQARGYPAYVQKLEELENKNPYKITPQDIADKADLEKAIMILESSIEKYVEEPCREAVKEHSWYAVVYVDLEDKYFLTTATMKRAVQKYIWGLAQEFGKDFTQ